MYSDNILEVSNVNNPKIKNSLYADESYQYLLLKLVEQTFTYLMHIIKNKIL